MAKITISEAAGNYDVDVGDMTFDSTGKYTNMRPSVLRYGDNKSDYVELHGKFSYMHGSSAYDVVKSVTSYSVVEDGDTVLTVSGLDIEKADVKNSKTLDAYFAGEAYTIAGNSHNNTITTGRFADILTGNAGNDHLYGMAGNDKLSGGSGLDVIVGGAGKDILTGGTQVDTFVFVNGDGADTITDFVATGRSHDVIDLSDYAGVSSFDDLTITRAGRDVHITLDSGDQITLQHVSIKNVDSTDFHF